MAGADLPTASDVGDRRTRWLPIFALSLAAAAGALPPSTADAAERAFPAARSGQGERMTIRLTINLERPIEATLLDGPAARDFAALLPLTLTLSDYASTEKISDLPKRLTADGAPDGFEPKAGDIAYYAPWGNLAIFHKGFHYSPGLVRLGAIVTGTERLAVPGPITVAIERAE